MSGGISYAQVVHYGDLCFREADGDYDGYSLDPPKSATRCLRHRYVEESDVHEDDKVGEQHDFAYWQKRIKWCVVSDQHPRNRIDKAAEREDWIKARLEDCCFVSDCLNDQQREENAATLHWMASLVHDRGMTTAALILDALDNLRACLNDCGEGDACHDANRRWNDYD